MPLTCWARASRLESRCDSLELGRWTDGFLDECAPITPADEARSMRFRVATTITLRRHFHVVGKHHVCTGTCLELWGGDYSQIFCLCERGHAYTG